MTNSAEIEVVLTRAIHDALAADTEEGAGAVIRHTSAMAPSGSGPPPQRAPMWGGEKS